MDGFANEKTEGGLLVGVEAPNGAAEEELFPPIFPNSPLPLVPPAPKGVEA